MVLMVLSCVSQVRYQFTSLRTYIRNLLPGVVVFSPNFSPNFLPAFLPAFVLTFLLTFLPTFLPTFSQLFSQISKARTQIRYAADYPEQISSSSTQRRGDDR
jgi:hypothetical protein